MNFIPYIPFLSEASNDIRLSSSPGKIFLENDIDRIRDSFFGALWLPYSPYKTLLLIGARSGLEILLAHYSNPDCKIFVIEKNQVLKKYMSEYKISNLEIFSSVDEFIHKYSNIDIYQVRVDIDSFSYSDLEKLLVKNNIHHLCGEMSENSCDPLVAYRLFSQTVDSFYFWIAKSFSISGYRKKYNFEVSVIVAVYGVENYLDECLSSLVKQTIKNYEIIVVDDGSLDNSGKIADEWAKKYPDKIRVIHKTNGGCASARQKGLEEAQGEYVAFVDGDDWVEPQMYEDLFRAAALRNADISQCGFYEFYPDQPRVFHPTAWGADGHNGQEGLVYQPQELLLLMPSIWRRIYKKKFLDKYKIVFPIHIRRHDDLPFAFLTLSRAERISIIPNCYYAYRLDRPGQDVSATDERLFIHFEIFNWIFKKIRPWANLNVINKLIELEVGTHNWVLSRLNSDLKEKYFKKATLDMNLRYEKYKLFEDLKNNLYYDN